MDKVDGNHGHLTASNADRNGDGAAASSKAADSGPCIAILAVLKVCDAKAFGIKDALDRQNLAEIRAPGITARAVHEAAGA